MMKSFRFLFPKRKNWRWAIFVALVLALTVVSTVYAVVTFDSYTGPQWLNPGYQFAVNISTWDLQNDPQTRVCLLYAVNSGNQRKEFCNCTLPACNPATNIGQWVCTITSNYNNSSITWDISAYHDASCYSYKAPGFSGSFTTGPTAVVLTSFTAEKVDAPSSSTWPILVIVAVVVLLLLALVWMYRSRKNRLAIS
jgi:hypothetical protein